MLSVKQISWFPKENFIHHYILTKLKSNGTFSLTKKVMWIHVNSNNDSLHRFSANHVNVHNISIQENAKRFSAKPRRK